MLVYSFGGMSLDVKHNKIRVTTSSSSQFWRLKCQFWLVLTFKYFQFLNVDQTSIDPSHNCTSELIGLILCLKTMVASLISIEFMYDLSIKKYFALGASYPEARIMII